MKNMTEEKPIIKDIGYVVRRLPKKTREILLLRFGLYGGPSQTLHQIGEKYNITRERVRQIEKKTLQKLRTRFSEELKPYLFK